MFTGIIEQLGEIRQIANEQDNIHFTLFSPFTSELKIDQSVAHNGTCLTVVDIQGDFYTVTAIQETLNKTNLGSCQVGTKVNLERCMQMNGRLDGHIVQGHVDTTATCIALNKDADFLLFKRKEASDVEVEQARVRLMEKLKNGHFKAH
jgi:riboflavin synthase